MGYVRVPKTVQSCHTCGKKLIEGPCHHSVIGSPLITCRHCTTKQRTMIRVEWYEYPCKWLVFIWPIFLPVMGLLAGLYLKELVIGLIVSGLFFLVGLCISSVNLIRAILSIRRMRKLSYLDELLKYHAISNDDYRRFRENAK